MEESVDVKALRVRFTNKASTLDTSSRDSGSPKSPRPGFGRATLPVTEHNLAHHRPSPVFPPPLTGPGPVRFPRPEPLASSIPSTPPSFPRPPFSSGVRAPVPSSDTGKVKQKGEMLQNMMLRHQRPPGAKPAQIPALVPALVPPAVPAPASTAAPLPFRQRPRQKSAGEVTPLRRPLPAEGPLPLKPKRPPSVNLEPFMRFNRGPALPALRKIESSPVSAATKMSLPGVISPLTLPPRSSKPGRLPCQVPSLDIDEDQDTYDDIASFERNESWSDNSSHCVDGDIEDIYEFIDGDQLEEKQVNPVKMNKKQAQKQREREKKEWIERQRKENELKKNFQLQEEIEVLHTAKVRHDWQGGGKLDLSVQQGESVEILRVRNNPGGKWLARSLSGNYGYISNTCVDIDYEAVKRKVLQSQKNVVSALPPPPPDPPQMLNMDNNSMSQDEDDYDDVQPLNEDFPLPPPEISIDPKAEKELRKRFKFEGPFSILHIMMVDPNSIIKRPKGKDLHVSQGEVLEIIELTNSKKALCRNGLGKYGYVSRSLLLPMEGDIYDDVHYPCDIYDNDSPNTDY
ncbi:FYN-binding protein 1 [Hippoglossus hippoglossus]|uniref:FYN-binding protein 1 n=1 Tax=Hippoglossus hippoglossus TaxID=8267 RepID=UPI00148D8D49|nr:FYN-binding protein 1 [Hippoglossus hippoglossus]XP_034439368.1 FYN-binding protein 1 [Hippoglossus hippoglossus]XP_034439369.1 FYN-binding protein 1 [Hippoglossus hippoglossus]XP_035031651.1 FYN-binding protein 1 [Hippoglossus stenolepis]